MDPIPGLKWKLENTWRLIALGRSFLALVDVDEIHVADLVRLWPRGVAR